MGFLWDIYRMSTRYQWDFFGVSMVFLWDFHGNSTKPCGISMGFLWDILGICIGYLDSSKIFLRFLQDFDGISMGCLWNIDGISKIDPWDLMGFV